MADCGHLGVGHFSGGLFRRISGCIGCDADGLGEAAEKKRLLESDAGKFNPNFPRELRSHPKLVQQLLKSCSGSGPQLDQE